jgi:hypothetical protein
VQLRFELSPADFRHGFRVTLFRYSSIRISICVLLLLLSVAAFAFLTGNTQLFRSFQPLVIVAFVVAFILIYQPYRGPVNALRNTPGLAGPRMVEISPEGLHVRTSLVDSKMAWDLFRDWSESKDVFTLYHGQNIVVPIPKRAMTPEQQSEFRELLKLYIKTKR